MPRPRRMPCTFAFHACKRPFHHTRSNGPCACHKGTRSPHHVQCTGSAACHKDRGWNHSAPRRRPSSCRMGRTLCRALGKCMPACRIRIASHARGSLLGAYRSCIARIHHIARTLPCACHRSHTWTLVRGRRCGKDSELCACCNLDEGRTPDRCNRDIAFVPCRMDRRLCLHTVCRNSAASHTGICDWICSACHLLRRLC
jgi:hypothetical protein